MKRRTFLGTMLAAAAQTIRPSATDAAPSSSIDSRGPNVLFVFGDQWRAQATGYNGDPNVQTPNLDHLATQSVNFSHAVSGCPVCSPYRASLLTGQYWLTHGVFLNDVPLRDDAITVAEVLRDAGYATGYIGKWHVDGRGRQRFIPPERRQGFDFWKVQECTHDYNDSTYFDQGPEQKTWEGYDALAQTQEAQRFIAQIDRDRPFALFLSWGPPHNPYETAPKPFRDQVNPDTLVLRPNVTPENAAAARKDLAGYYAHIMALDDCLGRLMETLEQTGLAKDTILVFTSDHGDMLFSHGMVRKQKPYDESIRVPFLIRYPQRLGNSGRSVDWLINAPDIMPTLLGLCGVPCPSTVEGYDFSPHLFNTTPPAVDAALLTCVTPFGEWIRSNGGKEFRGIRTTRYTYVRSLDGPWLLFDNETDPYQQNNLCGLTAWAALQQDLDAHLSRVLTKRKDTFEPGFEYIRRAGYVVDANDTVPVHP